MKTEKLEDTYVMIKDSKNNIVLPDDLQSLNTIRGILSCRIRDNEDIYSEKHKIWYSYSEKTINYKGEEHTVITLKNISKYKTQIAILSIDSVTGISTREVTKKLLEDYLSYSVNNKEPFAVIMADLDDFKLVNDTYGHYAGDIVLNKVAQTLKLNIRQKDKKAKRESDIVGRFGGDEFIIVFKNIDPNIANLRMEEIRESIEHIEFEKDGIHIKSDTISLGMAYIGEETLNQYHDNIEGLRTLVLTKADSALYESKKSGRNKSTSYTLK